MVVSSRQNLYKKGNIVLLTNGNIKVTDPSTTQKLETSTLQIKCHFELQKICMRNMKKGLLFK
jgi:hypothetical protein